MLYRVDREFFISADIQKRALDDESLSAFGMLDLSAEEKAKLQKVLLIGEEQQDIWRVQAQHHSGDTHKLLGQIVCDRNTRQEQVLPVARDWVQSAGWNVLEIVEQSIPLEYSLVAVKGIALVQLQSAIHEGALPALRHQ